MWAKKKTLFLKKANKKRFPHKISTKPPPLTYNTKMFRKNEKTKQKSIFASSWFHDKNKNIWTYTYAYIWLNIGMKNRAISFCMSPKKMTHESTKKVLGTYLVTLIFHAFSEVGCFAMLTSKLSTRSLSYEPKFILFFFLKKKIVFWAVFRTD